MRYKIATFHDGAFHTGPTIEISATDLLHAVCVCRMRGLIPFEVCAYGDNGKLYAIPHTELARVERAAGYRPV